MLIVLHEETGHTSSPLAKDGLAIADAARAAGCEVFGFSSDFDIFGTAEEALENVPAQPEPTPAVWIGFVPSPERYRDVYEAARSRNLVLLNDPDEYRLTSELDRFYPRLDDLTFRTVPVTDVSECEQAAATLGFPVFVKGAVRSARTRGWKACVAENVDELRALVTDLLAMENRSRGRVVVRQLARLRHARVTEHGFPLGREYRVLLHRAEVLGHGYYWEGDDPLMALSADEERSVLDLAREGARRVGAPFMTVDVGQLEDGAWKIVETGDPQFAGWSHAPRVEVFSNLRRALEGRSD
jgi:hypothetical protein